MCRPLCLVWRALLVAPHTGADVVMVATPLKSLDEIREGLIAAPYARPSSPG